MIVGLKEEVISETKSQISSEGENVFRVSRWLGLALLSVLLVSGLAAQERTGRKVKTKVSPTYPEVAKKFHLNGAVKVEVVIAPSGNVQSAKVLGGHPLLAESALQAVKQWKYEAANETSTQIEQFNFSVD